MQTTFAINTDELDERFLAGVKTMFPHRQVTICVEEKLDETEWLLANPRMKAALEKSIAQADSGELVTFTYEEFLALSQKLQAEHAA
ncbi:MAG: hypothetical protein ACKODH_05640 [Limisphaerales bacterium]